MVDPDGNDGGASAIIIGAIVGAIVGTVSSGAASDWDAQQMVVGGVIGCAAGAATGGAAVAGASAVTSMGGGGIQAALAATVTAATQSASNAMMVAAMNKQSFGQIVLAGGVSYGVGIIGGGIGASFANAGFTSFGEKVLGCMVGTSLSYAAAAVHGNLDEDSWDDILLSSAVGFMASITVNLDDFLSTHVKDERILAVYSDKKFGESATRVANAGAEGSAVVDVTNCETEEQVFETIREQAGNKKFDRVYFFSHAGHNDKWGQGEGFIELRHADNEGDISVRLSASEGEFKGFIGLLKELTEEGSGIGFYSCKLAEGRHVGHGYEPIAEDNFVREVWKALGKTRTVGGFSSYVGSTSVKWEDRDGNPVEMIPDGKVSWHTRVNPIYKPENQWVGTGPYNEFQEIYWAER